MSTLIEELRTCLDDCDNYTKRLVNEAADEIERLQKKESHLVNVGSVNKIKADAVRDEIEYIKSNRPHWHLSVEYEMMMDRLNKLERGEK